MPGRPTPLPESLEELPTVVTPLGARTPTPLPVPPPAPPPAVTPPPVPPPLPPAAVSGPAQSSYRPIEIPRQGSAWKGLAAAALVIVLLAAGGLFVWLSRDEPQEMAQTDAPTAGPAANPALPGPQDAVPAIDPTEAEEAPATTTTQSPPPAPAPRPADPAPEPAPDLQTEPAEPAAPPSDEAAEEPAATYTPPTEEPPVADAGRPIEEMRRLAGDVQTESAQLIDTYQAFLDAKDEAEQEITDDDELLQENIEELSDAAERFHKQLEGGGLIGRLRRRGEDVIKIKQRGRDLDQRAGQVETMLAKVQPNAEVRQAWQSIRQKWKRMAEIAAALR